MPDDPSPAEAFERYLAENDRPETKAERAARQDAREAARREDEGPIASLGTWVIVGLGTVAMIAYFVWLVVR